MSPGPEMATASAGTLAGTRATGRAGWLQRESRARLPVGRPGLPLPGFFIAYPFFMSIYPEPVERAGRARRTGTTSGFTNFQRIFDDPVFWQTVRNSFVFTFGSEAIRLVIGLPLAFALNRTFKGKRIVQGVILIPFVIPIALSSLAWKWMFDSLYSVINWMLMHAHIIDYPWQWLGEPGLAMWSVIILNVWRGFPFSAVILLAGLTAVPMEVIEAAKIDGAGPLRRFIYVVAPDRAARSCSSACSTRSCSPSPTSRRCGCSPRAAPTTPRTSSAPTPTTSASTPATSAWAPPSRCSCSRCWRCIVIVMLRFLRRD